MHFPGVVAQSSIKLCLKIPKHFDHCRRIKKELCWEVKASNFCHTQWYVDFVETFLAVRKLDKLDTDSERFIY